MVSINEMEIMLDEIVENLPKEFFMELNGGIILLPESKANTDKDAENIYILGEYHRDGSLGRYISIYYGSFLKVYGNLSGEPFKQQLLNTIKHEFRHHLESLAGDYDLEIEDAVHVAELKRKAKEDN